MFFGSIVGPDYSTSGSSIVRVSYALANDTDTIIAATGINYSAHRPTG